MTHAVTDALNYIGLMAFAISGALMAVRKNMDVVGIVVLAAITALGGGMIRDALIGDLPVMALRNTWWLVIPLAAAGIVFFFHQQLRRLHKAIQVFDAVGLGVFCAAATAKAPQFGLGPVAAVVIGVITGIGGGILRDLLGGEIPSVLRRDTHLYAVPAVAGCILVAVAHELGQDGVWIQALAAAAICGMRLLALWRRWGAPAPRLG